MSEATSQLSRIDRKIVEATRKKLPVIAEESCPNWNGGLCRETGGTCSFSTCPLVDRIADGGED